MAALGQRWLNSFAEHLQESASAQITLTINRSKKEQTPSVLDSFSRAAIVVVVVEVRTTPLARSLAHSPVATAAYAHCALSGATPTALKSWMELLVHATTGPANLTLAVVDLGRILACTPDYAYKRLGLATSSLAPALWWV